MRYIVLTVIILIFAPFFWAIAAEQELHIFTNGQARIVGAEITARHALNMFVVKVWGQKWTVISDYPTTFESQDGAAIKLEDIAIGHILEVRGRPASGAGTIEATLIRDLSIVKNPTAQQATVSAGLPQATATSAPAENPASALASPAAKPKVLPKSAVKPKTLPSKKPVKPAPKKVPAKTIPSAAPLKNR